MVSQENKHESRYLVPTIYYMYVSMYTLYTLKYCKQLHNFQIYINLIQMTILKILEILFQHELGSF